MVAVVIPCIALAWQRGMRIDAGRLGDRRVHGRLTLGRRDHTVHLTPPSAVANVAVADGNRYAHVGRVVPVDGRIAVIPG